MKCTGCVIAVGGAEDKIKRRMILTRFVRIAGASSARIVVLPAASMLPQERGELYANIFHQLGAGSVQIIHVETRRDANDPHIADEVRNATGVFLTGGVQLRLVSVLGGTATGEAIHEMVSRGGVYCGTSAGAAAVSSHMIVTGQAGMRVTRGMVDLAAGLGLVTDVIIDQHFSQRGRLGRLIASVALNPQLIGVGVDEDTAAIFHRDGSLDVIGSGHVAIVDPSGVTRSNVHSVAKRKPISISGLQLHLLVDGDRFDLRRKAVVDPPLLRAVGREK